MLTKAQIKDIRALTHQEEREQQQVFVAEGPKLAAEWLQAGADIRMIIGVESWFASNLALLKNAGAAELHEVDELVLERISSLQSPNQVLLVAGMPQYAPLVWAQQWYLALDGIQDPGNMGTIMRVADWFGLPALLCSPGCADVFGSKVVQSAMGAHLRVATHKLNLAESLHNIPLPIYAATLHGQNAFGVKWPEAGVLVIGNESQGITAEVLSACHHQVTLPRRGGAESLNASVSAGILAALIAER